MGESVRQSFLGVVAMAAVLTGATPPSAPVADAAMKGDLASVRALIARGANVNAAQGDGMTALHWAAERGDSALTVTLLRAKANVRAKTRIGDYTPLHVAARTGSAPVVRALLKAGSDAKATTTSGATPLHFAAAAGNPGAIQALLDHKADVNAREREWGQTPLVFAASFGRADAIRVLMKGGADASIHTTVVNLTEDAAAEQAATRKRNAVLVSFEPEKHRDTAKAAAGGPSAMPAANVSSDSTSRRGRPARAAAPEPKGPFTPTQIQQAIDSGRAVLNSPASNRGPVTEEVDTINGGVAGYVQSVGGVGGLTALHHAVRQGHLDAAIALLDGGANINDTSLVDGTTPLLMAIINGQFDVAIRLVERGANPNLVSASGMAPLYATINSQWAPRSRYPQPQAIQTQKTTHLDLLEALLAKGADVNARIKKQPWYFAYNNCGNPNCGLETIDGTTPFWRATYALDLDAMKLLIKHGADPKLASVPPAAASRARPARPAASADSGRALAAKADTAKAVTAAKPDSAKAVAASPTPNAAQPGLGAGTQFKLDPDIEVLAKAAPVGPGVLPIHAAAGVGYGNGFAGNSHRHAPDAWMSVMKYLVEDLHTDVSARDNNGYTALHGAAARGDNEMILYLVAHGADVKAVARNGRTVVDMANGPVQRLRPFPETIALLEKLGARNQHHCVSC